ncbi:hypothetical protein ACLB2K_009736 [Fragaria x ananassa]
MDILVICEPRVPFAKAKRFLKKHGFPDAEIEEARGFSGSIWVIFDKNKIDVSFVDSNPQSVTVKVEVNNHAWLLTALYASPTHSVRSSIWNYLSEFASSIHLPWLIIGDFNELYSSADKNGSVETVARDLIFGSFFFVCKKENDRGFPVFLSPMGCVYGSEEVYKAPFSIGGLKAPGVDGFPAVFFQKHWNMFSNEVFNMVSNAFSTGVIPEGLNHKLITLVPKVACPQDMSLFRPISLCCTMYKTISKVVVDRLRPYLSNLISHNQVSFVPGRQIADNIIIAQEVLHKFQHSKGVKGFMARKIDLAKAYDRLHWSFIENVLVEAHIPGTLIKLIMNCVSTTSFQVCVNGKLSSTFKTSRGIRQGDPLSPYLFVLCMEKLSHLIHAIVDAGKWKPVKASSPPISHLFFTDDLILFCKASCSQARSVKKCLDMFCNLSGQETYNPVIEKVQSKLSGWKSKTLNIAGRLTLVQAVTSTMPIYAMQTAKLHVSVCNSLDKLSRDFLIMG